MTISSYSLVLMVIHYLQYAVSPPVLPCLHDLFPEKYPMLRSNDFGYVDMNETIGPYNSKNKQTIGELFLYFLQYYSYFDYGQLAFSVRTGGLIPISVCRAAKSMKNDIHQWKELCIEEPFDLTNTARSVYDFETFERVKAVFVASWRMLKETLDLNAVFSPLVPPTLTQAQISTMVSRTTDVQAGPTVTTAEFSTGVPPQFAERHDAIVVVNETTDSMKTTTTTEAAQSILHVNKLMCDKGGSCNKNIETSFGNGGNSNTNTNSAQSSSISANSNGGKGGSNNQNAQNFTAIIS